MKVQYWYWVMHWYGGELRICSKHRTHRAAEIAAKKCEAAGGTEHKIVSIRFLKRKI